MKYSSLFLSGVLAVSCIAIADEQAGRYYAELQALKQDPAAKIMFDEDAHQGLAMIQRDIITYRNLTRFQRFVRCIPLLCDVVIVNPETMPLLYWYVDDICKKAGIATPTIFVTREDGFFNAFAQKFLASTGAILIGQKLMKELSDDALEAVVAHEIGHIKHDHVNKMLALSLVEFTAHVAFLYAMSKYIPVTETVEAPIVRNGCIIGFTEVEQLKLLNLWALWDITGLLASVPFAWMLNKRFEKEADQFAYEANGKAEGLIEFFELLLEKDELREEEFVTISELLQNNKALLSALDYYSLLFRYYTAKAGHIYMNIYKTIYHETFWGEHPSPEARIAAAREYLATQQG